MIAALRVYAQVAKSQMSTELYSTLVTKVSSISKRLKEDGEPTNICPPGLTEEQFTTVCQLPCDKFIDGKCTDPIAKKYPGKCDPILKFERLKTIIAKNKQEEENGK